MGFGPAAGGGLWPARLAADSGLMVDRRLGGAYM